MLLECEVTFSGYVGPQNSGRDTPFTNYNWYHKLISYIFITKIIILFNEWNYHRALMHSDEPKSLLKGAYS